MFNSESKFIHCNNPEFPLIVVVQKVKENTLNREVGLYDVKTKSNSKHFLGLNFGSFL